MEKSVDEIGVPFFTPWDLKISNLSRINEANRLNNEIVMNVRPSRAPRSTPNENVTLSCDRACDLALSRDTFEFEFTGGPYKLALDDGLPHPCSRTEPLYADGCGRKSVSYN